MNKTITVLIIIFLTSFAYADENMKIGSKGKDSEVSRVIKVLMYDNYYEPKQFTIKKNELPKFVTIRSSRIPPLSFVKTV